MQFKWGKSSGSLAWIKAAKAGAGIPVRLPCYESLPNAGGLKPQFDALPLQAWRLTRARRKPTS